jgi:hypothetical protein
MLSVISACWRKSACLPSRERCGGTVVNFAVQICRAWKLGCFDELRAGERALMSDGKGDPLDGGFGKCQNE